MTATFDNIGYTTIISADSPIWYSENDVFGSKYGSFYVNNSNIFSDARSKPKNNIETELIKNFQDIINELQLYDRNISIAAFTKYKSDIEKDLSMLQHKTPCYVHFIHPIKSDPQHDPVHLFSYDLAIVSDILECMLSTMARANIIKEALTSLIQGSKSCLIIKAKSEEDAEKAQEVALSEDDLISLALYAGAVKTWKLECMKEVKFPLIVASNGG